MNLFHKIIFFQATSILKVNRRLTKVLDRKWRVFGKIIDNGHTRRVKAREWQRDIV